jgi:hypothetical protein
LSKLTGKTLQKQLTAPWIAAIFAGSAAIFNRLRHFISLNLQAACPWAAFFLRGVYTSNKHFKIESATKAEENNLGHIEAPGSARKDKGAIHNTHHGVLSRHPLQALVKLDENPKRLRQIESNFHAELQPSGPVGNMLFDKMFSSYLRSILAAKLEARALASIDRQTPKAGRRQAHISAEEQPALVIEDMAEQDLQTVPDDLYSQLALVQKYDGHYSCEMFRSLGLLLALKNTGEAGLAKCIGKSCGANKDLLEG